MSIYLDKLSFKNLRSVTHEAEVLLNFNSEDVTIFDGPNGYGKSTVFDAIELLILGSIGHFNEELQNKGKIDLSQIANDKSQKTYITGYFSDRNERTFLIERIIDWTGPEESRHLIRISEDEDVKEYHNPDEEVARYLGISKEIFEVGMYVSQSDSLNFLQNKYKNRKKILTSILGKDDLIEKKRKIKEIKNSFSDHKSSYVKYLEDRKKSLDERISILEEFNGKRIDNSGHYFRLFLDSEYYFDQKNLDISAPYEFVVEEPNKIKKFLKNYNLFVDQINYNKLKDLRIILEDENLLKAYYYRDEILRLRKNKDYYTSLRNLSILLEKGSTDFLPSDNSIVREKFQSDLDNIEELQVIKKRIEKSINDRSRKINELLEKRNKLKITYENTDSIGKDKCPYCGNLLNDITAHYNELTEILKTNLTSDQVYNSEINQSIIEKTNSVWEKIEILISDDFEELTLFNNIYTFMNTDLTPMIEILYNMPVNNFKYDNSLKDENKFYNLYQGLKDRFTTIVDLYKVHFSEEIFAHYSMIYNTYFNKEEPKISIEEIDQKIGYIYQYYNDQYKLELKEKKQELDKIIDQINLTKNKADKMEINLERLSKLYEDSYAAYETDIVRKIEVPLYLVSGRILQTYQLGLGISINVKQNQVFFEAGEVKGDVFNILSMGQLNGVILSLLISLRKTFINLDGLNLLLIDDPLQSIDDVSTHSFIDLISEELDNTQVLLSTHEEDKSHLIKYKFEQVYKRAKSYNMQKLYMTPHKYNK